MPDVSLALVGTTISSTARALEWVRLVRAGNRPSEAPEVPDVVGAEDGEEPGEHVLRRDVGASEVLAREVMRIVISLAVLGFGLYFLIAGDDAAAQWASGALGAVVGYWLR